MEDKATSRYGQEPGGAYMGEVHGFAAGLMGRPPGALAVPSEQAQPWVQSCPTAWVLTGGQCWGSGG